MKKYPALAYEIKDVPGHYIKADDIGTTTDVEEAFLYTRKDGMTPNKKEIIELAKELEEEHKELMIKHFGLEAIVNFQPYAWLQFCNLVEVKISE
ncbi:hypothetical protein [Mammaliicoccus sciuri]|uniref:hypothetical protein n=1 Tax=Mammaliicoccus sciuri TaxID=1296 RepID=UPI0034DCF8EB